MPEQKPEVHEPHQSVTTQSVSNSYDVYKYANVFFTTEKIDLPRDKVVEINSNASSPSHGFKQGVSPMTTKTPAQAYGEEHKIGSFYNQTKQQKTRASMRPGHISAEKVSKIFMKKPPAYNANTDYYKEFWKIFLQNENLVADIDQTANQNYKLSKKIFSIKDFYENTLVPQIFT